jgi:serine/threonine-protein kinase
MSDLPSLEFLELQEAVAGRYSLERELGRGGMGIVFLAKDVALDRPVAIKLLPPELAEQQELRERFLREARTAAKLSHPNIIPVFSVEEVGEFVFFVMAYVEGETLTERIGAKGPLTPSEAVNVLREVSWALEHAHSQGVVHRDVKPDNIMVESASGRVLVTDFGIAQVAGVGVDTDFGEMFGTPAYMSPEQSIGESVDHRSDIYSFGLVAFLALAGRHPFEANEPSDYLAHHIRTPAPRLVTVAPGVPRTLSAIVERCLKKEPKERIQTGHELADALGTSLESRREIPVPVRLFVQQAKKSQEQSHYVAAPLFGLWLSFPLSFVSPILGAASIVGFGGIPFVAAGLRMRRVVKSGYGREDVVQAFQRDLESRDEELRFLFGPDYKNTGKTLRKLAYGALGLATVTVIGAVSAESYGLLASAGVLALAGGVLGTQSEKRSDRRHRRRFKFWNRRFGKWLFKVVSKGVKAKRQIPTLTNRPTELAVGMAVESLFESLPKETRASMEDLPEVVAGLEADAQRMRERIEDFNSMLQHAGHDVDVSGEHETAKLEKRSSAAIRIEELRDEAQQRLAESVAALENLRVDLLRLRAGTANLESVTTKLGKARDIAEQVDRLLESQLEVEKLLE